MIQSTSQRRLRTAALLVAAAALLLLPPLAAGKVFVTMAGGDDPPYEGDPVDSNDYGGGSGGSHDDIQDSYFVQPVEPRVPGLVLGKWLVLLVPDRSLGVTVFSFVAIERTSREGEGWDAQ